MSVQGKKLLILGANAETSQIVKRAQEKGIIVYVTDHIEGSYAKGISNHYFDINGMDTDAVVNVVKEEHIDGVMLGVADPLAEAYVRICKQLNAYCFLDEKLIALCKNKESFKLECSRNKIRTIDNYFYTDDYSTIRQELLDFPLVVKAAVGRGGRGVFLCRNSEELYDKFSRAKELSDNNFVIGEEYIVGDDCVATFLIISGVVYFVGLSDRVLLKGKGNLATVTYCNTYPSKYSQEFQEEELSLFKEMFINQGIQNGIVNIQMFRTPKRFIPYDPDCILNGEAVSMLFKEIYGVDLVDGWINYALTGHSEQLRREVDRRSDIKDVGASIWIVLKNGCVKAIEGKDIVDKNENVIDSLWRFDRDYIVTPDMEYNESATIARYWIKAHSIMELNEVEKKIRNAIVVRGEDGKDIVCIKEL